MKGNAMKKLLSASLAAAVIIFSTACSLGGNSSEGDSSGGSSTNGGNSTSESKNNNPTVEGDAGFAGVAEKVRWYDPGLTEMADGLPNVMGGTLFPALSDAVKADGTGDLKSLLGEFMNETDMEKRYSLTDDILHILCKANEITETSGIFDAKKMHILRQFWGDSSLTAPSNETQAAYCEEAYRYLLERYAFSMIGSMVLDVFSEIRIDTMSNGTTSAYMQYYNEHMVGGRKNGTLSEKDFVDNCRYLSYYGMIGGGNYRMFSEFRVYVEENAPEYLALVDNAAFGVLVGSDSNDELKGDDFPTIIYGMAGDDTVTGGTGNDLLIGGDGNDVLDGGKGSDCLQGNAGDDVYVFAKGSGSEMIIDGSGNNVIRFDGIKADELKAYDYMENDVLLNVEGTKDTLLIKHYKLDKKYRQFVLEFDGVRMNIDDPNSPLVSIDPRRPSANTSGGSSGSGDSQNESPAGGDSRNESTSSGSQDDTSQPESSNGEGGLVT